jgi:CHAD domain-containing protein
LADHFAPELERHLTSARRALDAIEHHTQVAAIHRARIKVKRLRYLLEAVDTTSRERTRAVQHLRLLQDALGELHDAHVMTARLTPLLVPAKAGHRAKRPALRDLRALRAAVRRRELAAFRRAMDLANARSDAAMWRDPPAFARRVLSRPQAATVPTAG